MAKFCGNIGFSKTAETVPGVWREVITERRYKGDIYRNIRKLDNSGNVNDNVNISNEVSIIADAYANNNFFSIKYVEFMGAKWKITSVDVKPPRLVLTLGGVYNAEQA